MKKNRGVEKVETARPFTTVLDREVTRSPDFVSIYTNDVQVQTSAWDLRLILGEITGFPTAESPRPTVRQLAELRMSPQLAKSLIMIMIEQLRAYETTFGQIPIRGPNQKSKE
jgi:hypothetical protein